jgi:Domain of unknown function (DUF4440)
MTNMTSVIDKTDVTNEILALERRFWTEADDPDTFRELVADGGISVIEPMGAIEKDQAISMTAEAPWADVQMTDVIVRAITPDVVILAYHGSAKGAKDGKPYRGSIASTYARVDGQWKLAMSAHQPWEPKS